MAEYFFANAIQKTEYTGAFVLVLTKLLQFGPTAGDFKNKVLTLCEASFHKQHSEPNSGFSESEIHSTKQFIAHLKFIKLIPQRKFESYIVFLQNIPNRSIVTNECLKYFEDKRGTVCEYTSKLSPKKEPKLAVEM